MMPYVITTRTPGRQPGKDHDAQWSRQAVATLDAAREETRRKVNGAAGGAAALASVQRVIGEDGGTIALRHASYENDSFSAVEIEVRRTSWRQLARDADEGWRARHVDGAWPNPHLAMHRRAVLSAYNEPA